MENILRGNYNNYYNRILKRLDTWAEYNTAFNMSGVDFPHYNFNPADGVDTKIVVGFGTTPVAAWENGGPDYLIVYDDEKTILSRWFIIDLNRTRQGQYELTLKRDVLADFYGEVTTSPVYVEKGVLNDANDPLICNNEGLVVNQIKQKWNSSELEFNLNDKSACPWLVMYLKKGVLGNDEVGPNNNGIITVDVPNDEVNIYEELSTPITSWTYYDYISGSLGTDFNAIDTLETVTRVKNSNAALTKGAQIVYNFNDTMSVESVAIMTDSNLYRHNWNGATFKTLSKNNRTTLTSQIRTAFGYGNLNNLMAYNNRIIKDSTGKYFSVAIRSNGSRKSATHNITTAAASAAKTTLNTIFNTANGTSITANDSAFKARVKYIGYRVELTELTEVETSVNFGTFPGKGTTDSALFDAICMPYGELTEFVGWEVSAELTTTADRSLKIMNSIATQLGADNVLDLQLLPYCPVQNVLNDYYDEQGKIAIKDTDVDALVLNCYNLYGTTDILLVCPESLKISYEILKPLTLDDINNDSTVPDTYRMKYLNDCTLIRVCSPNYNGLFEFNLAKNGGTVDKWNVDLTLRPYNPYIHVNPEFKHLYGYDFHDIRGLICGGDFSLGILDDAWVRYEVQNKNFQALFDRQIQNLDVNNAINKTEAVVGATMGTLTGGARGASAGSAGGPWGAVIGAAVGTTVAGIGGAWDVANLNKRQAEERDYALDRFSLQLGNVRALPNSITKTSALTANRRNFPFVEIYTCSDVEKEAYYNKLRYDGMTIGKIDTMDNYISDDNSNYFKGRLVRILSFMDDAHIANEINNELSKGVYI